MKTLLIKNTTPIQENFLGHNAVYHGFAGLPDDAGRVYSDELCELEADRAAALGVKIARTYFKWYAYDFEKGCWDFENAPDYVAFCKWVERLKVRGIDVAVNTGWCSPGDILSNGWGGQSPFTVEGDWQASVANYAKWVSDTVHDLIEVRGLTNVKYLVMFTEPQNGAIQEICPEKSAYDLWCEATIAADKQLRADGRRHLIKIVGPNEGSTVNPVMMKWVKENHPDLVDIYTAHNYLYSLSPVPIPNGAKVANGSTRGMRIQQTVSLKPHTEYEMSVTALAHIVDPLKVSGYMLMGAFDHNAASGKRKMFTAGGQPTNRLTRTSTKIVQSSELNDTPTVYTHRFTTEDNIDSVDIGVFFDIIQEGHHATVTEIHLKEVSNGQEILKNPTFNSFGNWDDVCFKITTDSSYHNWCCWVKDYLRYLDDNDEMWFDEYNTIGRGIFMDYDHPLHGTELAIAKIAFMNCGIQSSLQWTLFDQQWPNNHNEQPIHRFIDGDHRFGVMPVLTRTLTPYPSYYAMQITGYVGGMEGTKVYEGISDEKVHISMSEAPDGSVTILAVNDSDKAENLTVNLEKALNKTLYRYLYDPATIIPDEKATPIPCDKTFDDVQTSFTDTLPPHAVVAYTSKKR